MTNVVPRRRTEMLAQIGLGAAALAGIALWPPAEGAVLLLPIGAASHAAVVDAALAGGGRIVGTASPLRLLVVRGARRQLAGPLIGAGIVPLAAPASWCGA